MRFALSPSVAADALLLAYAVIHLTRPHKTPVLARGADRGATMILIGCYALGLAVLNTSALPALFLSRRMQWGGIGLQSLGLLLLGWSVATMKRCRRASGERAEWPFGSGPYRHIRHPAYLGSLLVWSGAIAASGNAIALVSIVLAMLAAYATRIAHEEQLLRRTVGASYEAYCQRSWRLIPFLY